MVAFASMTWTALTALGVVAPVVLLQTVHVIASDVHTSAKTWQNNGLRHATPVQRASG
jgi:hypothetical protein